jgi:hypothetical protein
MANTYTNLYLEKEKENFCLRTECEINMNNLIIKHINIVRNVILRFDGKVLNARLVKAIKELFKVPHTSCSLTGTRLQITFYGVEREMYIGDTFKGYISNNVSYFDIITNSEYRIEAEKTLAILDKEVSHLVKQNAEKRDCIDNFDKYLEYSRVFEEQMNEYKKKVPYALQFHTNISRPF